MPTTPEAVCFPAAAQVARVRRLTTGRKPETVALLTDAPPELLDAQTWLGLNRAGFGGIENGLHQRLDVSPDDDRCRVRNPNGRHVLGIFRRLGNSLFMEWRSRQANPHYLTTPDFHTDMAAEGHRRAMILLTAATPGFTRAPGGGGPSFGLSNPPTLGSHRRGQTPHRRALPNAGSGRPQTARPRPDPAHNRLEKQRDGKDT